MPLAREERGRLLQEERRAGAKARSRERGVGIEKGVRCWFLQTQGLVSLARGLGFLGGPRGWGGGKQGSGGGWSVCTEEELGP